MLLPLSVVANQRTLCPCTASSPPTTLTTCLAACAALPDSLRCLPQGDYLSAASAAQAAHSHAESAFSHPAVLTQLNSPDSHRIGVYMPFFLPVSVPIILVSVGGGPTCPSSCQSACPSSW